MSTPPKPRCVDCGARWSTLDDEGLCQSCFVARELRAITEPAAELHCERVSGQRLAAIIATAAARMPQTERALLWQECYQLLVGLINSDTHPELCATIDALQEPLPDEGLAAKWN